MQILQWLFKVAHEPPRNSASPTSATSSDRNPKKKGNASDKKSTPDLVVVFNRCGSKFRLKRSQSGSKTFSPFTILRQGDIGKACFYTTLNLRRLGSPHSRQRDHFVDSMKMKKEDIARGLGIGNAQKKDEMAAHVGNKVLPVNEAPTSLSKDQCGNSDQKKDRVKGDRTKTISRMKELLRWAAAAKAEKGGKYITRKMLQFRNRTMLKAVPDDDQMSNDSPKISFRWELESCSTTSSVYSALSISSSTISEQIIKNINIPSSNPSPLHGQEDDRDRSFSASRPGNWITTDSDFVVLEL